jgi:hypothetical protein
MFISDMAGTGVLGVLEASGLYRSDGEATGAAASSSGQHGSSRVQPPKVLPPGEGIGDMSYDEWAQLVLRGGYDGGGG